AGRISRPRHPDHQWAAGADGGPVVCGDRVGAARRLRAMRSRLAAVVSPMKRKLCWPMATCAFTEWVRAVKEQVFPCPHGSPHWNMEMVFSPLDQRTCA